MAVYELSYILIILLFLMNGDDTTVAIALHKQMKIEELHKQMEIQKKHYA